MAKSRLMAYRLFIDDFDGGTSFYSNQEVGAYLRLLHYQFRYGIIPPDMFLKICEGDEKISTLLQHKFCKKKGGFLNKRMDDTREEAIKFSEKQSIKGKKSFEKRSNHGSTTVEPLGSGSGSINNKKGVEEKNDLKIDNPAVPISEITGPLALDEKTISGFLWMDKTYLESVLAWQHYKISRMEGFSYEHSLKSFLKRLKSISNGIPEKAKMIVEYSMGKQYKDVYVPSQEEQNMYFANGKDVSKVSHGGKNLGTLPEGWLKKAINNG